MKTFLVKKRAAKKSAIAIRIPVSSRPGKVILPLKGKGSYRRNKRKEILQD
ncbi:MAG: hypothetical protein J0665_18195 [Deltaproteobacteria bacterium]|nr:hypothetical protein [Deltaproteobacteria bacterium]